MVEAVLVPGGRDVILCYYFQFSECYNKLSRIIEEDEVADGKDQEILR